MKLKTSPEKGREVLSSLGRTVLSMWENIGEALGVSLWENIGEALGVSFCARSLMCRLRSLTQPVPKETLRLLFVSKIGMEVTYFGRPSND